MRQICIQYLSIMLFASPPHARCKSPHIGEHSLDQSGFAGVVGVEVEGEALDEGRADDGGVGGARHFGGLLRGADAEADGDR